MLIIFHGKIDILRKGKTETFLNSLNVFREIKNIRQKIEEDLYEIEELKRLRDQDISPCQL